MSKMQPEQCPDCGATVTTHRGPGFDRIAMADSECRRTWYAMNGSWSRPTRKCLTRQRDRLRAALEELVRWADIPARCHADEPSMAPLHNALSVARVVLEETK